MNNKVIISDIYTGRTMEALIVRETKTQVVIVSDRPIEGVSEHRYKKDGNGKLFGNSGWYYCRPVGRNMTDDDIEYADKTIASANAPKTAKSALSALQDEVFEVLEQQQKDIGIVKDLVNAGLADKNLLLQFTDIGLIKSFLNRITSAKRLTAKVRFACRYLIDKVTEDSIWCLDMALRSIDDKTLIDAGYSLTASVINQSSPVYKTNIHAIAAYSNKITVQGI